jgi:hypothetical protein
MVRGYEPSSVHLLVNAPLRPHDLLHGAQHAFPHQQRGKIAELNQGETAPRHHPRRKLGT